MYVSAAGLMPNIASTSSSKIMFVIEMKYIIDEIIWVQQAL